MRNRTDNQTLRNLLYPTTRTRSDEQPYLPSAHRLEGSRYPYHGFTVRITLRIIGLRHAGDIVDGKVECTSKP